MQGSQSPLQPVPSLELLAWQRVCSVKPLFQAPGLVMLGDWQGRGLCPPTSLSALPPAPFGIGCTRCLCSHCLLFFSGNTNSIFALDYISGALTLNGPLDRENPFYSTGFILTVKVRPPSSGRHTGRAGWGGHPAWGQLLRGEGTNLGHVAPVGIQSRDVLFPGQAKKDV